MSLYDGMCLPAIAFNRYTAIANPTKHSKIWTIKRTILISLSLFIIPISLAIPITIFKGNGRNAIAGMLVGFGTLFVLILAFIGSIITIDAVILSRKKFSTSTNEVRAKAERTLLYFACYNAIVHFYRDVDYMFLSMVLKFGEAGG
uniref:Uncharacterized protein n=1 Tax=Panagrolaimus sp. JU765 TaxID=591449 RepID=A0AC34RH96_9BILA